jgi:hypothetical protein
MQPVARAFQHRNGVGRIEIGISPETGSAADVDHTVLPPICSSLHPVADRRIIAEFGVSLTELGQKEKRTV